MADRTPSMQSQRRQLLPRSPSDRVVVLLLVAGIGVALAAGADPVLGLVPGGLAALAQKVRGHIGAWRSNGVERAFVMESTAISFYVLLVVLVVAAVVQASALVQRVDLAWLPIAALFIDTTVRSSRESRFA